MIKVSKEEAMLVQRRFPDVYVTITGRGKEGKRKTRYVEESSRVMALINSSRNRNDTRTAPSGAFDYKRGERNGRQIKKTR